MELLKGLTEQFGVSGSEEEIRNYIIGQFNEKELKIDVDKMGNLLVSKQTVISKSTIMICAHMDEVGFIVTSVTGNGLLKFEPIGGIDLRNICGKRVFVGKNKIPGIITTLPDLNFRNELEMLNRLFIDIGGFTKEQSQKLVSVGDYVAFDNCFMEFGNGSIRAKAIDDRAGCAILIKLLKHNFKSNIVGCFTVQEETGLRGSKIIANCIKPDIAIIVDCTPSYDLPGIKQQNNFTYYGKGTAITICDRIAQYDRDLVDLAINVAAKNNIPLQIKKEVSGATDAAAVQLWGTGVRTITVSIPCKFMHSNSTIVNVNDFNNSFELIFRLIEEFDRQSTMI